MLGSHGIQKCIKVVLYRGKKLQSVIFSVILWFKQEITNFFYISIKQDANSRNYGFKKIKRKELYSLSSRFKILNGASFNEFRKLIFLFGTIYLELWCVLLIYTFFWQWYIWIIFHFCLGNWPICLFKANFFTVFQMQHFWPGLFKNDLIVLILRRITRTSFLVPCVDFKIWTGNIYSEKRAFSCVSPTVTSRDNTT